MSKVLYIIFVIFTLFTSSLYPENYLINGGQKSQINYRMTQRIGPSKGSDFILLSYVVPTSFSSPTYNQHVISFNVDFSIKPDKGLENKDENGNKIIRLVWLKPETDINISFNLQTINETILSSLQSTAEFPLTEIPQEIKKYLLPTNQVPSDDYKIKSLVNSLLYNSETEYDAVQQILAWVVDHMRYVLMPSRYDAMYSFVTGKGNCQNYSHLSAALLRAAGIPARIVNGVTLKEPYEITAGNSVFSLSMAQGRHSWIEVWFPDLGWVPFDPQQTALYVSNRFIRIETGMDNDDTSNDGLIRWSQTKGEKSQPRFEEQIEAVFVGDKVTLTAEKQWWGPQKLIFSPQVNTMMNRIAPPAYSEASEVSIAETTNSGQNASIEFGNLEFPENISFLSARGNALESESGDMEMRKNFMVETAEYVTTAGNQYAQTFIVKNPLKLDQVGLALHKFGGEGQVWVVLLRDNGSGTPGDYIATSEYQAVNSLPFTDGYSWVDFSFKETPCELPPGRYWVSLGFTGTPIINWFYTYGKTVGPVDGTRCKTIFDDNWSKHFTFEFNYRIKGHKLN